MSKLGNVKISKNSAAAVGSRAVVNLIEGANITLTIADDAAGDEIDVTIASAAAGGTINVSKNSGAIISTRPELNFIEGANITLTIVDDGVNNECDITIAAGGGSGGDLSQWYPASDPNAYKGNHPSMIMHDNEETVVRQSFIIPYSLITLVEAVVVIIPDASGNLDWEVDTDFGQLCGGEQYDLNDDSTTGTTAVTSGEIECIDISAALTGATAKDLVGIEFKRDGDDASDTVNADVHFIGIWIRGTEGEE